MKWFWIHAGLFVLQGLPSVAAAAHPEPFGFALMLERYEVRFAVPDRAVNSVNEKIGITLWEPAQSEISLGLTLGQLFLSQSDYPTVAGRDFNGYFVDLSASRMFAEFGPTKYLGEVAYGYQQAADSRSEASVRWHTLRLGGGLRVQISRLLALSAAATYGALRGVDNTARPVQRTVKFEESTNLGATVGVELNVDRGGYVGLSVEAGARHGLSLNFARRY